MSVEKMIEDVNAIAKTGAMAKRIIDMASLQLFAGACYHRGLGGDRDHFMEAARKAWMIAEGIPRDDCINQGVKVAAAKMQDIADRMAYDVGNLG